MQEKTRSLDSLILRRSTRFFFPVMLVFSVFFLVRGHNAPGGGFVAGLIGSSAFAALLFAFGPDFALRKLRLPPLLFFTWGFLIVVASAVIGLLAGYPAMKGLWFGKLGSPILFDVGVYLIVFGSITGILSCLFRGEK